MKLFSVIAFISGLVLGFAATAHDGHVHEPAVEAPPHGGLLRDALPFKSEIVLNGEIGKVYLYDKDLKPLKPEKATLKGDYILPRQKKSTPITLSKNGDHYEVKLPGISKVHRFDLHVYLEHSGKKGTADFGIDNIQ